MNPRLHYGDRERKPGLPEVLAILQQFGPTARLGQQMDAEKLHEMQAAREFATQKGYAGFAPYQAEREANRQDEDQRRRSDQEDRMLQAEQNQSKMQTDASFLDAAKLVPMVSDQPQLLEALYARFPELRPKPAANVNPNLRNHIP